MILYKFMSLWKDYRFFRINVILVFVGIMYLLTR